MPFIKTHWISLSCAAAGVAFLGLTVWGMTRTSVEKQMQARLSIAEQIRALQRDPVNPDVIAAEDLRGKKFQEEFEATLKVAHEINRRPPLLEGVFPKPAGPSAPYQFREQYSQAIRGFSGTLRAEGLPTEADVADEAENVAALLQMEAELNPDGTRDQPAIARQPGAGSARGVPPEMAFERGGGRMPVAVGEGGEMMMRGVRGLAIPMGEGGRMAVRAPEVSIANPSGEPKYDPLLRARVNRARSIRCYADARSFHVSPIVAKQSAPTPLEMWQAQAGYWIQKDVVDAIAELNNEAALRVTEGEACVEHTPVKRIESLVVHGYVLPNGEYFPFEQWTGEGAGGGSGSNAPPASFTRARPDDEFDVLHFTLTVVVDQRKVMSLIDHICRRNLCQLVDVEYARPGPEDTAAGYLYGTAPVIRARLGFEVYMLRAVYAPLMPTEVRTILGIKKDEG